jgi:hypothetical protein
VCAGHRRRKTWMKIGWIPSYLVRRDVDAVVGRRRLPKFEEKAWEISAPINIIITAGGKAKNTGDCIRVSYGQKRLRTQVRSGKTKGIVIMHRH